MSKKKKVKKAEEVEEKDQPKADEAKDGKVETEDANSTEEAEGDETPEEKAEDESTEEESDEGADSDESADETLKKLDADLAKMDKNKKETIKKLGLQKTVNAMASSLSKMLGILKAQEERIVKLEATPAETKSKAAFVHKSEETKVKGDENTSDRPEAINKRLAELLVLKEKLGPNQFAKQGFSTEAGKLQDELERMAV